jgi:hypothetical protein
VINRKIDAQKNTKLSYLRDPVNVSRETLWFNYDVKAVLYMPSHYRIKIFITPLLAASLPEFRRNSKGV